MTAPRIVLELGSRTTRTRCDDCPWRKLVTLRGREGARSKTYPVCAIGHTLLELVETPAGFDTVRSPECLGLEERKP